MGILMVLEALTSPVKAEKRPVQMFLLGFLYASAAMGFSLWIFYEYSSLVMVFLTVFASIPIIYNTIKLEEKKDEEEESEAVLLKEHGKALEAFMFLFIGFAFAFALWFVFLGPVVNVYNTTIDIVAQRVPFVHVFDINLPPNATDVLFSTQTETFHNINARVVGMAARLGEFSKIFLNNMKRLLVNEESNCREVSVSVLPLLAQY